MGIFTRFKDIVNSNINALLDKAEDPEKMLKLIIQEMEDTIIDLKSSCSARMAEEIKLINKIKDQEAYIERWLGRAQMAIQHDKQDLAREALIEKRKATEALDKLKENLEDVKEDVQEGKEEVKTLEDKLEQAKLKLKILQEKKVKAEEKRSFNQADLNSRFDAMEERINQMNAWNELNREKPSAEDKFSKMEQDAEIEKELEALKESMK